MKAAQVRTARLRSGALSLGVGVLLVGAGAAVGLDALPSKTLEAGDRATFASLLMGFGRHASLDVPDPIESGWQDYTRARSIWGQARLHVIALRSGGYVGLSSSF